MGKDTKLESPTAIYDEFWQMFAQNYSGFQARHVNWDSLYTLYRPQVSDQMSDRQLLAIIEKTIQPLHDNHVLVGSKKVGFVQSFTATPNVDFPGLEVIRQTYAPSLQALSYQIHYAALTPEVGYIHLGTFANDPGFAQIDQVLESMKNDKAIIIDIRDNNGGNDANGLAVAGRFTTNSVLFGYVQWRNGPGYTDFTPHEALYLASRGKWQFTRPVYLLTNRYVFSAGNSFVMMMRALPNVIQIGQPTGDGVAGPTFRELSNGWLCGISSKLESLPNKQPVEGVGIMPNHVISNESLSNRDLILEHALFLADTL
ncbi:S41 family peptidase [Siphonobacter sp. BAB-5385]|uniref:S41 family peptidase n=2 Tax=unclassified Siphonobacter TaxID=2635712 RepID=UPI001595961E|nr:S41 family peptidase [Siphonobacter sp. BAB-5385]